MCRTLIAAFLCCAGLSGCAVFEAQKDQDKLRGALLDLYTNQIMDNLIRAHNRLPIIQLDYTTASAMVTIAATGSFSDSHAETTSNVLSLPSKAVSATNTVFSTLMGSVGLSNTNQITLSATPLITANEVYDAYFEFLGLGDDSLLVTSDQPPPGAAHICRKCDTLYYWVPVKYRDEFMKLALVTTAQRGKALQPQDAMSANVTKIISSEPLGLDDRFELVTLQLDGKIPNDSGYLVFSNDLLPAKQPAGSQPGASPPEKVKYPFEPYVDTTRSPPHSPSETQVLKVTFRPDEAAALKAMVPEGQSGKVPVKVYLLHSRPQPPTAEELLQRANAQLLQLNQNVVRQGGL